MASLTKFAQEKEATLKRMRMNDRSRKGSVDARIAKLVQVINKNAAYYTTSSCSGRIRIIGQEEPIKKNETQWLFTSHEPLSASQEEEMIQLLSRLPTLSPPCAQHWFLQESAILHVACESIDAAQRLLTSARERGFKRSGLQSAAKRLIVELVNNTRMETIIAEQGSVLISEAYAHWLVRIANKRLERNFEKINALAQHLQQAY